MNRYRSLTSRVLAVAVASVLVGCVDSTTRPSAQAHVDYRSVEAPGTQHYEELDDEVSTATVPLDNPAPEYPANMIALHLPHVAVAAKLIVDTQGNVSEVRIEPAATDTGRPAAFDDAVRSAVVHWHYTPLRFRTFEDVLDAEGNVTDTRVVKDKARPFSLDYEFSFDLRDGKPVVTGGSHPRT